MKLIDLLEKDKENLLTELSASKATEKAVMVLENELDKLLLMYNEKCSNKREREAAAYMMQAIRLSLPLIDSVGDTKLWETTVPAEKKEKRKMNPLVFLFFIGALVLCGFGLLPFILPYFDGGIEGIKNFDVALLKPVAFVVGGIVASLISGLLARRPAPKQPKRTQHVEIQTDPAKIYRSFRNAILSVDQNPEYALEKIEEIKYYLHRQQIEVVDYSENTAQFFDMMPGLHAGTIRPAMVADGKLLRKGVASSGA